MKFGSLLAILLVSLCLPGSSIADNGALALVRPVDGIIIDGDFSDWSPSLPWYPIERTEFALPPDSASDLTARFRIGYDSNAIYLAVEVRDDSTVIDEGSKWSTQDGCSVYLDIEHRGEGSKPIQFNVYGNGSPQLEASDTKKVNWSCHRSGEIHRYEWRLDLGQMDSMPSPGRVLGFDVSICDKDDDDSFSWIAWGPAVGKAESPMRLGDLMLISDATNTGIAHGRFVTTSNVTKHNQRLKIQSLTESSPITVWSDSDGQFELELPVGQYRAFTVTSDRAQTFQIEADQQTSFELQAPALIGQLTDLSLGDPFRAGTHTRHGPLHSYRWSDDLRWGAVHGIAQAADRTLWIASHAGLARFDGSFIAILQNRHGRPTESRAVAIDQQGTVWSGNSQGIYRYDGNRTTRFTQAHGLIAGAVNQLVATPDGSLWIRAEGGISCFADNTFTTVFKTRRRNEALAMAVESPSRVWLGTPTGLVRLDRAQDESGFETWKQQRFTKQDGLPSNRVRSLLVDSRQRLWIGTVAGLACYDGNSFQSWNKGDGLSSNTVIAIREGANGHLWVGTEVGLQRFNNGHFFQIGNVAEIGDLFVDCESNVWIAAGSLMRFNANRPFRARKPNLLSNEHHIIPQQLELASNGDLWIASDAGAVRARRRTPTGPLDDLATNLFTTADGLPSDAAISVFEDSQQGIWIGTKKGACRFDGQTLRTLTTADGLTAEDVRGFSEDSGGRIWMATAEGITIYDPAGKSTSEQTSSAAGDANRLPGTVAHLSTMHGLPHNDISSLYADGDDSVWIGLMHGNLCRWRNGHCEQFNRPYNVSCFLPTDNGELYAGAEDGLYQYDGNAWNHVAACGQAHVYGLCQGDKQKNQIWIATSVGLKVYDGFAAQVLTSDDNMHWPLRDVVWDDAAKCVSVAGGRLKTYRPRSSPPPIKITAVTTEGEHPLDSEIRFLHTEPRVRFYFHGISFSTLPDAMRYRYRLRGWDDEWKISEKAKVYYDDLPAGSYLFEVAAIDRDLNYSLQPASIRVRVDTDYRPAALWTCFAAAILLIASLATTVVRRNRGIRRLNVELDQRVKDRTAKLEAETAENRKLQEQLLQTQKLDAVGTMASGIAHDFNNSLAVISGFAEIAKNASTDPKEFIDHILTATKQAAGTTKSLLTFSRDSPGEKAPQDLIQLVRETTDFLRRMLPTSISVKYHEPASATIWSSIDTAHIQQVLVNVAMNARDAMQDRGEISISVELDPNQHGFARLSVSDNGCGMSAEVRERIFDPFFTTKSRGQGTGLGMSIVHGIIKDHQGSIQVESAPGEGSTILISLPLCEPCPTEMESPRPLLCGRGELILVAEDHRDVQTMIQTQLSSAGFRVLTADDGADALRLLEEHHADIHVALLDIDLPIQDGKSCLREISQRYPRLPVIMMSGLSSVDPLQLETPFLRKPFDCATLLSTVNTALRPEPEKEAAETKRPGGGVLVIDDDNLVRLFTKALLANSNIDVFLADSRDDAISQLRKHSDRIGTALLDWNLPQTDPESVLRELRDVSPRLKVVVVTGDLTVCPNQVEDKGFQQLLVKPVSSSELVDAVA